MSKCLDVTPNVTTNLESAPSKLSALWWRTTWQHHQFLVKRMNYFNTVVSNKEGVTVCSVLEYELPSLLVTHLMQGTTISIDLYDDNRLEIELLDDKKICIEIYAEVLTGMIVDSDTAKEIVRRLLKGKQISNFEMQFADLQVTWLY